MNFAAQESASEERKYGSEKPPSLVHKQIVQINSLDEKLGSAMQLTDTKFQLLNEQLNQI